MSAVRGRAVKFCVIQLMPVQCLIIRSVGRFRGPHMQSLMKAVSNLDCYREAQILHDMRWVDFDVPIDEVMNVARNYPRRPRNGRLAVVSSSNLGFGMLRVIASVRENAGRTVCAFLDIAEALEWLSLAGFGGVIPEHVEAELSGHIGADDFDQDAFGITMRTMNEAPAG